MELIAGLPGTRKSGIERRRQIAAAALFLIGSEGIKALTAARLAASVGVTPGALYRHFDSLEQIVEASVDHAIARVEASMPPADLAPLERVRRLTAERVALVRAAPGLGWLLLSDEVRLTIPASSLARLEALVARSRAYLREAVCAGQADGSLRADLSPAVILTLLSGTVHALARAPGIHATAESPPETPDTQEVLPSLLRLLSPPTQGKLP